MATIKFNENDRIKATDYDPRSGPDVKDAVVAFNAALDDYLSSTGPAQIVAGKKALLAYTKANDLLDQPGPTETTPQLASGPSADADPNAVPNPGYSNMGDMLQSLYRTSRGQGMDERLLPLKAAIGEGSGAGGGFAVPDQFVEHAIEPTVETPILLRTCDRIQMTSNEASVPGFADDDHSTTAPFGITWSMVDDNDEFAEDTGTKLRSLKLIAHKYGALVYVSNSWLDDTSVGMQNRLTRIFSTSLSWYVEKLLWSGNGAAQPMGVRNADSVIEIAAEAGQAATTIVVENICKMWSRLLPGAFGRALWAYNQTAFPQLASLSLAVGTGGGGVGLIQPGVGATGEPANTIFGRPIYPTEHLPSLGTSGDLLLLDPLAYLLGDRRQVTVEASQHFRFSHDQTAFRIKTRFDGRPEMDRAITPENGDSLSWAVKIADR